MSDSDYPQTAVPRPLEWPMLLAIGIPMLILATAATMLAGHLAGSELRQAQALELKAKVSSHFQTPANWNSEKAYAQALAGLDWQQAYLEDDRGARIWQRDRQTAPASAWPTPSPVRIELDRTTHLVLMPEPLAAELRQTLHRKILAYAAGLHLLALFACGVAYLAARRPLVSILRWSDQLEKGELTAAPPRQHGLSGAVAASMGVLAQRLRFSRDALNQHSDHADRRYEGRLLTARREIQRLRGEIERTREDFATHSALTSGVSHELRTPLTAILGFSELLDKGPLNDEQRDYVQTIRKSAKGLVSMINDVLDVDRMEAGRLEIHERAFDVNDVVEDTLSLLAPLAYEKQLDLIRIVDHDIPEQLRGDAGRLQQILTNLVSNAIKFTEQGRVLVHVSSTANAGETVRLRLQVEDTGVGLSTEQQRQLFSAYQRFDENESRAGSGLGLTIVKRLTELLGGSVDIQSEPGRGSTFAVNLPLQVQADSARHARWDALRERRIWALQPRDGSWRALQHLLAFWQLDSRRFSSAAELNRTLQSISPDRHPDLLLLDLRTDELAERPILDLMAVAEDRQVPVIGLVNSVDNRVHREFRELGAGQVLAACCDRAGLYRACCELLSDVEENSHQALDGISIVVAENNAASRHYLRALLDSLGAAATLVDNGNDALEEVRARPPRFVLLDQNMPGLTGIETTRRIRELEDAGETAIIGMSAYLNATEQREWMSAGLDALLSKPFDESQLLRCLQPWLRGRARATIVAEPPRLAESLLDDPELAAMMLEELPRQLQELDDAYISGIMQPTRDAAHQLHGTAAFYHLEPLKGHVQRLEKRLNSIDDLSRYPWLRDDMADVAQAVRAVCDALRQRQRGAPRAT